MSVASASAPLVALSAAQTAVKVKTVAAGAGAMSWLGEPLFHIKGLSLTPLAILTFLLVLGVGLGTSVVLRRVLRVAMRRAQMQEGPSHSLLKLTHYVVVVLTVYTALVSAGVNLTAFYAVGGALMVGVGFGMQNIMQNFISGLILLVERPAAVGDIIRLGTLEGRVVEIRTRCTIVNTRDNMDVIVPNSDLLTGQLINLTYQNNHRTFHSLRVSTGYGVDPERTRQTLLQAAQGQAGVMADPPPYVFFEDFGESALVFRLGVWTEDQWTAPKTLSDLRFAVERALRQNGIEIPYPHRVVYSVPGKPGNNMTPPKPDEPAD